MQHALPPCPKLTRNHRVSTTERATKLTRAKNAPRRTNKSRKRSASMTGRTTNLTGTRKGKRSASTTVLTTEFTRTRKAPRRRISILELQRPGRDNHAAHCAERTAHKRPTCLAGDVAPRECPEAHTRNGRKASQRRKCGRSCTS